MNTNERSLTYKKIMPLILVYAVMVGLSIVANFLNPGFLSLSHIWTIVRQMSFLGIVCIGQTLVILTGGIDLSMQYTLVLCNVVSAQVKMCIRDSPGIWTSRSEIFSGESVWGPEDDTGARECI